jgi:hypothetical protein
MHFFRPRNKRLLGDVGAFWGLFRFLVESGSKNVIWTLHDDQPSTTTMDDCTILHHGRLLCLSPYPTSEVTQYPCEFSSGKHVLFQAHCLYFLPHDSPLLALASLFTGNAMLRLVSIQRALLARSVFRAQHPFPPHSQLQDAVQADPKHRPIQKPINNDTSTTEARSNGWNLFASHLSLQKFEGLRHSRLSILPRRCHWNLLATIWEEQDGQARKLSKNWSSQLSLALLSVIRQPQ